VPTSTSPCEVKAGAILHNVLNLEVPVVEGNKIIGYALFLNVKVRRAWNVYQLLHPMNVPFWVERQSMKGATSKAAESN